MHDDYEPSSNQRTLAEVSEQMIKRLKVISKGIDGMNCDDLVTFSQVYELVYNAAFNAELYDKRIELELSRTQAE
jgi:hypothetical protein